MTNQSNPSSQDDLVDQKRSILMDMLSGVLNSPRKESSVELWKLHIDAALDRLDAAHNSALKERLLAEGPKDKPVDWQNTATPQTIAKQSEAYGHNDSNEKWRSAINRVFGGEK